MLMVGSHVKAIENELILKALEAIRILAKTAMDKFSIYHYHTENSAQSYRYSSFASALQSKQAAASDYKVA